MTFSEGQRSYFSEFNRCQELLDQQSIVLEKIATSIYRSLNNGGVLHVFGSGHSHTLAEELFHRAGGLVPVNAILEDYLMPHKGPSRVSKLERTKGIASTIFHAHDLREGECILLSSNSGMNAVTSELAQLANEKGLTTIAFTSLTHSKQSPDRGVPKLYSICDYVIDTGTPYGDACVKIANLDVKVAPLSTLMNVLIAELLVVRICELYAENGKTPPVYQSANTEGGEERNKELENQYRARIQHLI
tara:strand:- start:12384 stop:13124 length:741 start_codon:yes stop_codon:yes gene_type:complete